MSNSRGPVLLDVTRLVRRSWSARQSNGIDRVCDAYLDYYREDALAALQIHGVAHICNARHSQELFALLRAQPGGFKARFAHLVARSLATPFAPQDQREKAYINVSHTDFDLASHVRWVRRLGIRAHYFIHDLIPTRFPHLSRPYAVRRNRARTIGAINEGAGLIVGSNCVARDLRGFADEQGLALPPMTVAPIAGMDFSALQSAEHAPKEPYFLCVATIEPRKNHRLLFEVWSKLASRLGPNTPRLILVGAKGPMTGHILAPVMRAGPLARFIEHRSNCSDAELADLLRHTRALLMPSLAEGFGLPVVEALGLGTEVVASDIGILREVGLAACCFIDPIDANAWAREVEAMLTRPSTRPRFVAPNWTDHFARVDRMIQGDGLKSSPACESSLAA